MSSSPTEQGTRIEVTLPDLGPDVLEASIVAWERRPGERVEQDEPICVVGANGMRAVVASSESGTLVRLLAGVGTRVEPGASLAEIELESRVSEPAPDPEPEPQPEADPEPEPPTNDGAGEEVVGKGDEEEAVEAATGEERPPAPLQPACRLRT
jgi:pyruvate/2-oxoglutarate dehydrogenase complex dihydrolipoamide acyltransferase (E2) component